MKGSSGADDVNESKAKRIDTWPARRRNTVFYILYSGESANLHLNRIVDEHQAQIAK